MAGKKYISYYFQGFKQGMFTELKLKTEKQFKIYTPKIY